MQDACKPKTGSITAASGRTRVTSVRLFLLIPPFVTIPSN